jgi:serine/threonine protein kinase/Leucine-rich repeat (LRR) protein
MLAQTVVCPSCRTELRLKGAAPAGVTHAPCPKCGTPVPLTPPGQAPHPTHPGSDTDASVADRTQRGSAGGLGSFPFLAPAQRPDEIGRLGPYRVLGELGRGGMGVVFRAEDPALRRQVALKVMLPQFAADPGDRARFVREARAQAAVEHEHVAAIYQVGEDRGVAFLAMPLLRGQSLADALRANPRVPVGEAVRLAREVAAGLAAAHERGLVHRDVKPGNIWLEGKGRRVKILDFGLARPSGGDPSPSEAGAEVTVRGAVIGTPAYMSPEQARGEGVDGRSDLFSVGAVLYQLLTGRQPFRAASTTGVLIAVATEHPVPPSAHNPSVPGALDALVMSLLGKDPRSRPDTADVVAEALAAIEGGLTGPIGGGSGPVPTVVVSALPAAGGSAPDPWAALDDPTEHAEPVLVVATKPHRKHSAPDDEADARGETKGPSRLMLVLGVLTFVALIGLAVSIVLRFETKEGTLVVEINDQETEARVKGGKLVIIGPDGKERYTLSPTERNKKIDAGPYMLRVEGADGAVLVTREFVIKKGEKVNVRVTVADAPAPGPKQPNPQPPGGGTESDRRAADYVVSIGGTVRINGDTKNIQKAVDLPANQYRLTYVDLSDTSVTDLGLANFQGCKNVTSLYLNRTTVTDAGLVHFKDCTDLTLLSLINVPISDAGLEHFKNCKRLSSLNLQDNRTELQRVRVSDAGLANFKDCKDELTFLDLGGTRVGDKGLAHFKGCRNVTYLNLLNTLATAEGLANFKDCKNIATLWLYKVPATDAALAPFAESRALFQMQLGYTKVTDDGLAPFANCPNLHFVGLGNTAVGDVGLTHLSGCAKLATLQIYNTRITDAGLVHLAGCKILSYLDVADTALTDGCVEAVARLEALTYLDLRKTKVTATGVANLHKALPGCKIDWDEGTVSPTPDRAAAVAVLALGGTVRVNGQNTNVKVIANLPPRAFRLTSLDLAGTPLKDPALTPLRGCTGLTSIGLDRTGVGDAAMANFAGCNELTDLSLGETNVGDTGAANFKGCTKLKYLFLNLTRVTDAGLANFAGCNDLRTLNLFKTATTDAGMVHFEGCTEITKLVLGDTKVGDAGLARFAGCKKLGFLDAGKTAVTDVGVEMLRDFKELHYLHLAKTGVTDKGLAAVAELTELTELYLWETQIGDAGAAHLRKCGKLTGLSFATTRVTDAALEGAKDWPNLATLYLNGNDGITDVGLAQLKQCKRLTYLDVGKTKVSADGLNDLKAALPKCKIIWNGGTLEPK